MHVFCTTCLQQKRIMNSIFIIMIKVKWTGHLFEKAKLRTKRKVLACKCNFPSNEISFQNASSKLSGPDRTLDQEVQNKRLLSMIKIWFNFYLVFQDTNISFINNILYYVPVAIALTSQKGISYSKRIMSVKSEY